MLEEDVEEYPTNPVYHDGWVHLCSVMCETCVLRPGNLMHLSAGRVKGMVEGSIENNGAYACHKTLYQGTQQAICRGFWDKYRHRVEILRLAEQMHVVKEIEPPNGS